MQNNLEIREQMIDQIISWQKAAFRKKHGANRPGLLITFSITGISDLKTNGRLRMENHLLERWRHRKSAPSLS